MIVAYPDDVSVVELVLERHDFPHEAEGAQLEEGVPRLDQHQYSSAIQIIRKKKEKKKKRKKEHLFIFSLGYTGT